MFNIGDFVVKAGSGICRIDRIEIMQAPGSTKLVNYFLLIPQGDLRTELFVPVHNADKILRNIITEEQAEELISNLFTLDFEWIENNRKRERMYKDTVREEIPNRLGGMINQLYNRRKIKESQGKKTTAAEERYLSMAEGILFTEMAHALGTTCEGIKELVMKTKNT